MTIDDFKELIKTKPDGKLFKRECTTVEFKQNFNMGSLALYTKTMAAFANNTGGVIIFGITDRPRLPIGMTNNNFLNIEIEKITLFLNEHYSPEIVWTVDDFDVEGKKFGVISVEEAYRKPVICRKNTPKDAAYESDIFYRYSGRSEKIKFPELQQILEDNRELEQKKWMEHIENIARLGPRNVALIDVLRGEIETDNDKKIIIDKNLLKDIKFIQEGRFVEKEGAPALKLIGNVEGMESIVPNINLADDFYTTKELGQELGLLSEKGSTYYISAVIEKYKIKENPEYFQNKKNQNYYSRLCLEYLRELNLTLDQAKEFLKKK